MYYEYMYVHTINDPQGIMFGVRATEYIIHKNEILNNLCVQID